MRTVHRWTSFLARGAAAGLTLTALLSSRALAQHPATIGGIVYAQYSFNTSRDTVAADSAFGAHANNFDVTRAYLNFTNSFDHGIATRVTADIYNAGGGGTHAFRLKYAYVNWTPDGSPITYRLGLLHTPFIDYEEQLWDYRMEGPTAVDRNGFMTSSDFGAAVEGAFNNQAVNFLAGVYDGEGYGALPGDAHKDLAGRVTVRVIGTDDNSRIGGLRLTGYAQIGAPTGSGKRQRFLGEVSYHSHRLTLAAEYAIRKDSTEVPATPLVNGSLMSVFGVVNVPNSKLAVIGRVDILDPNTAAASTKDRQTRFIGGVSYQLSPQVRLLADVDQLSYQGNVSSAQYASRGTANLHAQFTF